MPVKSGMRAFRSAYGFLTMPIEISPIIVGVTFLAVWALAVSILVQTRRDT
jgi:hypothetical protein